jgi:8-oxo-dGTP pyrophosphatase MutT (NUDIX family)
MSEHINPTGPEGTGYLPGLAIDLVIFGFHEKQLKVLLLEYQNTGVFALPAGFIREEEDLNEAARRALLERTGLQNIYLEQYYVFGDRARHDPEPLRKIMKGQRLTPGRGALAAAQICLCRLLCSGRFHQSRS